MPEIVKTMKLHLHVNKDDIEKLKTLTKSYMNACNHVSEYIFNNGFQVNYIKLHPFLYHTLRKEYKLKSQFAISAIKTVAASYKTLSELLKQDPYTYNDEDGKWHKIPRTLEWLQNPNEFHRPQADLVRGRDYSFSTDKKSGLPYLSLNSLSKTRIHAGYDVPDNFRDYFNGDWNFGTGKIVELNGEWYFHMPMTRMTEDCFSSGNVEHIVWIDRGLRFVMTTYDEECRTKFISGSDIAVKREKFNKVRSELQSKGTKSAKRVLKRLSGRENRWMTDVNHQLSKTLVSTYGKNTLFVMEDLSGVSFDEKNLKRRSADGRYNLRSWSFYQLEQFITYKAHEIGSKVLKVSPEYTSQRCPKCGRIHKENRNHELHEYICDKCGYRSNDDRIGAMNIYELGRRFLNGVCSPAFSL